MEGDLRLRNIALDGQPLGALALVVRNDGSRLRLRVQSDFTNAEISGEGEITPRDRFPVQGHLEFRNVDAASVLQVLKKEAVPVRIAADGEVSVSGDAVDPEGLRLGGTVTRLTVNLPENTAAPRLRELRNPEPVRWRVANRTLFVESAHLVGEGTDLRCSGSAAVSGPVNFAVKGSLNLAVFGSLGPNLDVKGISVVDAAVTGQMQAPDIRGNLEIRNASVGSEDLPLSLNNVNGAILFSRYAATVQKLSGEAGGGQIAISGDASFLPGRPITYRLRADARQIRLRYPRGVSSTFEGALSFTGTNQQSLLAGEIRITRAATRAAVDLTGLLASLKEPTRTPSRNDWLQDAQLNVTISTAPDIRFDTSLARNLQADASLRLRGTVLNPALLGRINLTQGEFEFQGSRYTINRGDITFSNPIRIEPILNLDLETKASGYDIVLTLAGPLQKLNVSYRSDPPLPFNEVITLLALGRSPTSDTSIAAQQLEQTQGLSQIGASGVIGQAISQPVSGRLQRFFGVSRLKLDPELVGPEGNPNARVTLEQQVSKDVTFTYIYNLASVQEQIVRVQWSLSSQLSVVAVRDQNGVFGIDFLYRRRYR
jgi:translocation and assembly module TamB